MALRLFLLFTLIPAIELFVLVRIGTIIGPLATVAWVILAGVVGAWLAKREGFAVLRQLQADLQRGIPPATRLVEGALVIAGSVLLITPGVFSDFAGILLLFPPSRRWLAPRLLRWLVARFGAQARGFRVGDPPPTYEGPAREATREPAPDRHFDHPVR